MSALAVLKVNPEDKDAVACKVATLIDLGKIREAIDIITAKADYKNYFAFEYAYCLYREGKLQESLSQLETLPGDGRLVDRLRLEAQLRFRMEEYQKAIEVYSELFKSHNEDSIEAKTNVIASYVAAGRSGEVPRVLEAMKISPNEGLELAFNVACGLVNRGELGLAREQLLAAHRVGEELLFEEGLDDEEVAAELAAVDAQLAYIDAVQGRVQEAKDRLKSILELESQDEAANVVATADLCLCQISLHPNDRKGALEQLKRLERFLERSGGFLKVQISLARRVGERTCQDLLGIYACTALTAHKTELSKEAMRSLDKIYPNSAVVPLVHGAILAREGKVKEASVFLDGATDRFNGTDMELPGTSLSAQLAAHVNDYVKAAKLLEGLPTEYSRMPAVVATMTSLFELHGDNEAARNVAQGVLHGSAGEEPKKWALKTLTDIDLARGDINGAVEHLLEYVQLDENAWEDPKILALLPRCVACCDPSKSHIFETKFPMIGTMLSSGDVDGLESQGGALLGKNHVSVTAIAGTADEQRKRKKKRKRKVRYPQGFDPENPGPPPDPERWLPKWQRAENKKLRKKRKEKVCLF